MCIRDRLYGVSPYFGVHLFMPAVGVPGLRYSSHPRSAEDFHCGTQEFQALCEQLPRRPHLSRGGSEPVSYTHLRAHETKANLVCRLLLEKKKKKKTQHV